MKKVEKKTVAAKKPLPVSVEKQVVAKPLVLPKIVPIEKIPSTINSTRDFKPWAVWIWNLLITKEEIVTQLQGFIDNGFAGVAIKVGRDMSPAFMSEEFFALFNEALLHAQKHKFGIRFAEDFSMPLSDDFNALAQKNTPIRAQNLVLEFTEQINNKPVYEKIIANPETAIVQIAKVENERILVSKTKTLTITADKPVISWKQPIGVYQVMVFRKKDVADSFAGLIPNVFREQTAKMYSDLIWEAFHKHCSKFMPSTFEGFVSEIPAYLPCENSIPWDDDLIVKYRSKYKKDLLSALPSLYFQTEVQEAKNRPHIYSFLLQSMHERFTSVLDKWCKKYRLSNWVLCAERPITKSANVLRNYMTIPEQSFGVVGIQNQEGSEENAAMLRTMADANSREFKRETITVVGRNRIGNSCSLQTLKSEVDQSAHGGASTILLDGCFFNIEHRSYIKTPVNPSWYSPASKDIKAFCDYAFNLKKLITGLQITRQVAILSPTQSVLTDYLVSHDEIIAKSIATINSTMQELSALNLDYDIISEEMLLTCSLFSNGEFNSQSKVRKGNYQALVIPYCRMASKNLFVYLEKMAIKKATIIFIGDAPHGNIDDGVTPPFTQRVAKLMRSRTGKVFVTQAKDLETVFAEIKPVANISILGKKCNDLLLTVSNNTNQTIYTIQNKSDTADHFATLEIPEEKYFYISDCANGHLHEIETVERLEGACRINFNLAPHQTYHVIASPQKEATTGIAKGETSFINVIGTVHRNYRIVLKDQWDFVPNSLNALPLAAWNTRIGLSRESGGFSHFYETYFDIKEVPSTMLFSLLGLTGANTSLTKSERSIEINVNGIRVNEHEPLTDETLSALVSPPSPVAISVTETSILPPVPVKNTKPCLDVFTKNVLTFNIKDSIRKGTNRISMRTLGQFFDPMTVVYPPIIAGNFCLIKGSNGFIIDTTMPVVSHDSWTKYGFPYMSGCGTYKQVFEIPTDYTRLVLKFSKVSGSAHIVLNEKDYGRFNWSPMEIDITDVASTKRNDLTITIVNTIDNLVRMNNRPSGLIGEAYLDVY